MFKISKPNPIVPLLSVLLVLTITSSIVQFGDSAALYQLSQFLSPPYYGTTSVNSVFDHNLPLSSTQANPNPDNNGETMHYDGAVDGDGARSWYDQHRGIDYGLQYELVRAAAPGTVAQAGWASPGDHRGSYGLHVRIEHDLNSDQDPDYRTIYGHMSALYVQTGDSIPVNDDEFQRIMGVSGNTGWCVSNNRRCTDADPPTCGAHLHFQLEEPRQNGWIPVNPYGWVGTIADPWSQYNPDNDAVIDGATSVDRWLHYPSITNNDVFPSGIPLVEPSIAEDDRGYIAVDDGDTEFAEDPTNCWTGDTTTGWGGDHRYHEVTTTVTCAATWNFPETQRSGNYNVFVHIPAANATSDAAQYAIQHTESAVRPWSKLSKSAVVNQAAYPNNYHLSSWVYIGTYYFDSNQQHGTDYVRLEPQPLNPTTNTVRFLAADAVRFSPVIYRLYLPLVLKQWPPVPATPILNPIANPDYDPNYDVTWSSVENTDSYTLQEASTPGFGDAVTRYSGPDTAWAAVDHAPGEFYYRVKAANAWGDSLWSGPEHVTAVPPNPCKDNFMVNGNFEDGLPGTPWEEHSSCSTCHVISTERPHLGAWGIYMGGYNNAEEWIRQPFVVPSGVNKGVLVFTWYISSTETIAPSMDVMTVGLQDASGEYLPDYRAQYFSVFPRGQWYADKIEIDNLAGWAGQTLQVNFAAITNSNIPTQFFVDDVVLVLDCNSAFYTIRGDEDIPVFHLPSPPVAP